MLEEKESLSAHFESNSDEQCYNLEETGSEFNKGCNKKEYDKVNTDQNFAEKIDKMNYIEVDQKCLIEEKKVARNDSFMNWSEEFVLIQQIEELGDQDIREKLKTVTENELFDMIKEIEYVYLYGNHCIKEILALLSKFFKSIKAF